MPERSRDEIVRTLAIAALRLPLLALGAVLTLALLALGGGRFAFPPAPDLASLYFIVVNLVCLAILRAVVHRDGGSLRALVGFAPARLGADVAWGLLWIVVLYLPFVAAILGTMALLFGSETFTSFERVFTPADTDRSALPRPLVVGMALATAILFPIVNAPTEELWYRGYAQRRLGAATGHPLLGVLLSALLFGVQHTLLAPTGAAMAAYAVAFFVWGLGAGLIYRRQGRLMPLIVAHFCTNAAFSVAPLVFVLAS